MLAGTILVVAAITSGCSSSSTTLATPTGADSVKCPVSLGTPSNIDASGGTARLSITTQPECGWNVSSAVNWIFELSAASGQGNGDVEFRVAPNDGSAAREGEIVVNDSRVRVSQRAPCRYDVGPQNQGVNAGADEGSVSVRTQTECGWTATTDVGWITLSPPVAGNGNGTVGFTVTSNGGSERTGSIIIAGQGSVVTQAAAAAPCTLTISPASQSIDAAGGAGTAVTVSTQAGCRWNAASNAAWVTVTSGSNGTGNGSVGFTVAANTGASRTGTLTIGGRAFTVTQAAAGTPPPTPAPPTPAPPTPAPPPSSCKYSISPADQSVEVNAGTRTVRVSTTAGCSWTAGSNASWITVTSGATGTGDGSVSFSYAANTGTSRTGTLTIAGQTFTLTQAPCAYSISPDTVKMDEDGGTGTINVSTGSACRWTASSNDSWITITAGASGTGDGTVRFTVARNDGKKRNGTLTIAGRNAKVEQEDH